MRLRTPFRFCCWISAFSYEKLPILGNFSFSHTPSHTQSDMLRNTRPHLHCFHHRIPLTTLPAACHVRILPSTCRQVPRIPSTTRPRRMCTPPPPCSTGCINPPKPCSRRHIALHPCASCFRILMSTRSHLSAGPCPQVNK